LEAFILVNVDVGLLSQILESVSKVDGVKTAYRVTGQFNAVILAQFPDLDDLRKMMLKIHRLKGVLHTQTLVTVPIEARVNSIHGSKLLS